MAPVPVHPARPIRRLSAASGLAALFSILVLLGAAPANATPGEPTTSADAKKSWQDGLRKAEIAAEKLNGTRARQQAADRVAAQATEHLKTAQAAAGQQAAAAQRAAATATSYQQQLDKLANASFRGASLNDMNALLAAQSADDFLDRATALDRVAADTEDLLAQATLARSTSAAASAVAATAEQSARTAKATADEADASASAATASALATKTALDAQVARDKALYDKLSAAEKAAASAAAAAAKAKSEADAQAQAQPDAEAQAKSRTMSQASADGNKLANEVGLGSGGDDKGRQVAALAMGKVGGGYCYACDGPVDFDCSGLTTWAWAQVGISIPRVSYEQATFPEVPLDQLQPGDLVTYYSPVSHVAMYVGNGMVVSAADEQLGIIYVPVERGGPDATGHRVPR